MRRIRQNFNIFKHHFLKALSILFSILSAVLLLISREEFGINSVCRAIMVFAITFIIAIADAILVTCFYRKKEVFDSGHGKLILKYDDLWRIAFPNHRSCFRPKNKRIVVVSVNTTFDTLVDTELSTVKKPLVSANTMHGQWVMEMQKHNVNVAALNDAIQKNLECQEIKPVKRLNHSQKSRGNLSCFEKGTIAVYEYDNTIFYLLALSEFDENNNAQSTKNELIETIERLIAYYDNYGQGYELYIPLLGTGMSRTDVTPNEALQIIVSYFKIYKSKIHGNVSIVVYKKQRDAIPLDI